eukprot:gb/GEZN01010956.1/.p1 GENE.gb/GEZN01010956.1/~~gb/GEZN01010956.1/.p1  ORF type:complete len:350 (-),score=49.78 gb/GEZN01010956.1/:119-1168(-)
MEEERLLFLTTEPNAWGLPSHNPHSVAAEAYLRLAQLPFVRVESVYSVSTVTGPLPSLQWGNTAVGGQQIIGFLAQNFCDLDSTLQAAQQADATAWSIWAQRTLYAANLFLQFQHKDTFYEVTTRTVAFAAPTPTNWIFRHLAWQRAVSVLEGCEGYADLQQALASFETALGMLSARLGKHHLLFPQNPWPSSADVWIASFLATIYHHPATVNPFRMRLLHYPALVKYLQYALGRCLGPLYHTSYLVQELLSCASSQAPTHKAFPPYYSSRWFGCGLVKSSPDSASSSTSDRDGTAPDHQQQNNSSTAKKNLLTPEEMEQRYNNYFIIGSIGVTAVFVVWRNMSAGSGH